MRITIIVLIILAGCTSLPESQQTIIVEAGIDHNHVSQKWLDALESRQSKAYLDSLAQVSRPMTPAEKQWLELMQSKAAYWNTFRDSLNIPFGNIALQDTIYVLAGYLGDDDGFTYQHETICFDLTAFQENYDSANLSDNKKRIDRIFAHEYTHLLHKAWAEKNKLELKNFKDSILWECLYEGIGMYRSLSKKWMLKNDSLPQLTREALDKLYPVLTARLIEIHQLENPTAEDKAALNKNLSRGNIDKKWGAFPMAIWLMQEAKGDDKNLIPWINGGPQSVIKLAMAHLPEEYQIQLQTQLQKK